MGSNPKNVSASRVSAIAGLNPYKTAIDAWISICSDLYENFEFENKDRENDFNNNPAIKLGLEFENVIMDYIEIVKNIQIVNREGFFESEDKISTCHIDGSFEKLIPKISYYTEYDIFGLDEYDTNFHGILNIEIKTTSSFVFRQLFGKEKTDEVPEQYFIQCQQQMGLSNSRSTVLAVLVFPDSQDKLCNIWWPNNENFILSYTDKFNIVKSLDMMGFLKFYHISFNKEIWDRIRLQTLDFWNNYILKVKSPPSNGFEDLRKIFKPVYGTCIATQDIIAACKTYTRINSELDRVESNKDMLKGKILQYMMNNSCDARKKEEMILLNSRGFQIARMGSRFTVKKEKDI